MWNYRLFYLITTITPLEACSVCWTELLVKLWIKVDIRHQFEFMVLESSPHFHICKNRLHSSSVPSGHFPNICSSTTSESTQGWRLNVSPLKPRADVVVRHVACAQWEIVLRLNDRKMSMDKNVKSGLAGRVSLPDVVWHVFRVVSGGYNKVRRRGGGAGVRTPPPSSADVGRVVFPNNYSCF